MDKQLKIDYANHLKRKFGELAADVIDEILKFCGEGSITHDLKHTKKYLHKCKCGNDPQELHTCPYAEEINGDDTLCNCCNSCVSNCCDDI